MEEPIIKPKLLNRIPKWLKIVLITISIITMVYWLGLMVYKILCAVRIVGSFIFSPRNYWTFLCCIVILIVGSLVIAQVYFGLDPFGKIEDKLINCLEYFKQLLIGLIGG